MKRNEITKVLVSEDGRSHVSNFLPRFQSSFPSLEWVAPRDVVLAFDGDEDAIQRIEDALDESDGFNLPSAHRKAGGLGWRGKLQITGSVENCDRELRLYPYVGDRFLILRQTSILAVNFEIEANFEERPSAYIARGMTYGPGSMSYAFYARDEEQNEFVVENPREWLDEPFETTFTPEELRVAHAAMGLVAPSDEDEDNQGEFTLVDLTALTALHPAFDTLEEAISAAEEHPSPSVDIRNASGDVVWTRPPSSPPNGDDEERYLGGETLRKLRELFNDE